jgi:hypothetical protein
VPSGAPNPYIQEGIHMTSIVGLVDQILAIVGIA